MSGVRTSKTVNGTTYNYTTLSGKVMRQQWGNKSLEFIYDDGNQPFAMIYNDGSTSTLYYYVLNAQGDVIALLNANGTLAASYNYGAWGNYSVHGADGKKTTDATFIGHINPLRYRGYYYDRETRLYYLQSRYYDFANCRFINADTFATTDANGFLSANMFAYCENNPVMRTDEDGEVSHIVIGAIVGAAAGIAGQLISDLVSGGKISSWQNYVGSAIGGALGGAVLAATGKPKLANAVTDGMSTLTTGVISKLTDDSYDKSWGHIVGTALLDTGSSALTSNSIKVPKVTVGRGNMNAVFRSGLTKLRKHRVKRMSGRVMRKGFFSLVVGGAHMSAWRGLRSW